MKQKRAAIYTRVSTNQQHIKAQESELIEFAERRSWKYEVYCDHGESGSKEHRPALDRLLADARRKRIDAVLVVALDRLARSLRQLLSITEEFASLGVDLIATRQNLDTSAPSGRLTYAVLGAVAEFERELLRERVRAGLAHARRNGKRIGRPPLRQFSTAELNEMRQQRASGASVRKLAMQFGTTQWMVSQLVRGNGGAENQKVL